MEGNEKISPLKEIGSSLHPTQLAGKIRGDKVIWGIAILLALFSMLAVYSATSSLAFKNYQGNNQYFLIKQIIFILIGFAVIYFAHLVNFTMYSRLATVFYILVIPLLIYTLFFGVKLNEGSRWIKLPIANFTIQTSDIARLALFIFMARLLHRKQDVIKDFKKGFLPVLAPVLLICALIAPANLSTALLLGATCLMLMFIGRARLRHIGLVVGIAAIPLLLLIFAAVSRHKTNQQEEAVVTAPAAKSSSGVFTRIDTWVNRVERFIYGSKDIDNDAMYQVNQAKIAIAKGGILGKGPGNSTIRDYLPQAYNDFIYAIIIEEYGLIGGAFIAFLYLAFLFRCIRIYKLCQHSFGCFLVLGLSFTLAIQAISNMAVAVNLFPVTGVTLPLVSMGGSSFLFTCLAIGIVLSVSRSVEGHRYFNNSNNIQPAIAS